MNESKRNECVARPSGSAGLQIVLGCGAHHRFAGHTHVDSNPLAYPDVCQDVSWYVKSLPDDSVSSVIAWHVLEHIPWEKLRLLIDDLWRVSRHGCIWNIRVPHCTSIHAANPQHRCTFSTTFWDFYGDKNTMTGERYGVARLRIISTELHILALATGLFNRSVAKVMPNWLFNRFGKGWQMFCERFWLFRYDEIAWTIAVAKPNTSISETACANTQDTKK